YTPPRLRTLPLFPYTTLFRPPQRPEGDAAADRPRRLRALERQQFRISGLMGAAGLRPGAQHAARLARRADGGAQIHHRLRIVARSEEHTSELQSLTNLVCRLL